MPAARVIGALVPRWSGRGVLESLCGCRLSLAFARLAEPGELIRADRHRDISHRSVLVLRDVIELDTAETATCLGINEDNVRVRLHRARQALAASLTAQVVDRASSAVWQFAGDRCDRMLTRVMEAIGVS